MTAGIASDGAGGDERGFSRSRSRSPIRQESRQRGRVETRSRSGSRERGNKYSGGAPSPARRRARSRSIERGGREVDTDEGGFSRRPPPPPPPSSFAAPMSRISSTVRERLKSLYDTEVLREGELDVRALGDLSLLNEEEGLIALDELSKVDLSRIRNISAFFVGICKRTVKRGLHGQPASYLSRGGHSFRDHAYPSYHYDDYQYQDYRRGGHSSYRHQEYDNYGSRDSYYGGSMYDGAAPSAMYQRMDYLVLQGKQRDRPAGRERVVNRGYEDVRWSRHRGGGVDYERQPSSMMDSEGGRYRGVISGYRGPSTSHYDDFRYVRSSREHPAVERDHHYYDERAVYESPPRYHR